ncbi:GSK-3-binding protein-like [Acipenser oxyrinchus oxyrinchus]|uniref:GSK-3-binding protein-like n=1 Tax=Acipenser oxyrinchus oxyrinchus TaxID=40147 RepID=A0AAD8GE98_ACIOX|nr:GSK-3-binding protein-like [Acipenser oxyrinchus oxyrinchus]
MPCRKENYIFLARSVTVDSKEVDALVTKIGEALQLHNNNTTTTTAANQKTVSCLHSNNSHNHNHNHNRYHTKRNSAALQKRPGCCFRLRSRANQNRGSPYSVPQDTDQDWGSLRAWDRKKIDVSQEDDPHQVLQELILSGNLIKEAVKRLQFSAAERADHSESNTGDNLQW